MVRVLASRPAKNAQTGKAIRAHGGREGGWFPVELWYDRVDVAEGRYVSWVLLFSCAGLPLSHTYVRLTSIVFGSYVKGSRWKILEKAGQLRLFLSVCNHVKCEMKCGSKVRWLSFLTLL